MEAKEKQAHDWLAANLLTAAALEQTLPQTPIVVGGTAEAYWTGRDVYHPTDLDLWLPASVDPMSQVASVLHDLGFRPSGRHWVVEGLDVVVEFPSGEFAGDERRIRRERIDGTDVFLIGLDDLYLARLRQSTANESEGSVEFLSALSVATHRFDAIDWRYVSQTIAGTQIANRVLGLSMRKGNSRIRSTVRRRLAEADDGADRRPG